MAHAIKTEQMGTVWIGRCISMGICCLGSTEEDAKVAVEEAIYNGDSALTKFFKDHIFKK